MQKTKHTTAPGVKREVPRAAAETEETVWTRRDGDCVDLRVFVCVRWSEVTLDEMLASLMTPLPSVMVGKQPSDTPLPGPRSPRCAEVRVGFCRRWEDQSTHTHTQRAEKYNGNNFLSINTAIFFETLRFRWSNKTKPTIPLHTCTRKDRQRHFLLVRGSHRAV